MKNSNRTTTKVTIGLDLGDKHSHFCVLAEDGEVIEEGRVRTTPEALRNRFQGIEAVRIAIETGTHSPWVSRLLEECGHEVIVANARQLRLIYENNNKLDEVDAEYLARLARVDPELLNPVQHRSAASQAVLATVRTRDALVEARTMLVNHVRGSVKSFGSRIVRCSTHSFDKKAVDSIPEELSGTMASVLEVIRTVSSKIKQFDKAIEKAANERYPETQGLRQVTGVGALTALAFILILEDPRRFAKSRMVGPFLGLTSRNDNSGQRTPQLRITKAGDRLLRRLLVGSAHYILGPFGPDSDLRRHGEAIAARGGKNAKKRAVVAVARKLAVLLHSLWISGQKYEPLRNTQRQQRNKRAPAGAVSTN